jgi:cytoskeletal protein CcmA (bactofilin family)
MFKSKKSKIDPNMTDTLIGEGTRFEGKIKSEAGIRIEGHLTGDIECAGDVTIGEKGTANSNIRARHVVLAGTVNGNITASGTLTIKATGRLMGNLTAQELSIEAGGYFQGNSKMELAKEAPGTPEEKKEQDKGSVLSSTSAASSSASENILKW